MLEYLDLQRDLDRDDLEPWQKRTIINVLDGIERQGYMNDVERIRYHLVRDRVLRALNGGYPSGAGHRAA